MTRNQLRVLFILPLVLTVLGIVVIETAPEKWPQAARDYLQWNLSQKLAPVYYLLNRAAIVGVLGLVASTIGLMLFWGPARYIYVASLLLTFGGDLADIPLLIDGWAKVLESIAQTLIGLNIALIFTGESARHFGGVRAT
jgi:hypothetical protein